jgi:hypothetical protein
VASGTTRWRLLVERVASVSCAACQLSYMLGLTLIPLGGAIAATARLPRAIGYLMGLSGLAYIMQGCVLGTEGFSGSDSFAILGGYVVSWHGSRRQMTAQPPPRARFSAAASADPAIVHRKERGFCALSGAGQPRGSADRPSAGRAGGRCARR